MDGGGRLHRRPPRRRHARQTISARLRSTRESTNPTSTDAWTSSRTRFRRRISKSWSIWNLGADDGATSTPRTASRCAVAAGRVRSWKVGVPDADSLSPVLTVPPIRSPSLLFRNFEFKLPLDWLLAVPVGSANGKRTARQSPAALEDALQPVAKRPAGGCASGGRLDGIAVIQGRRFDRAVDWQRTGVLARRAQRMPTDGRPRPRLEPRASNRYLGLAPGA